MAVLVKNKPKHITMPATLAWNNEQIEFIRSTNTLDVWFSEDSTWKKNITHLQKGATAYITFPDVKASVSEHRHPCQ